MIKSFADRRTRDLFVTGAAARFPPDVATRAARKLEYVDLAMSLDDLNVPLGNRLHALKGDRRRHLASLLAQRLNSIPSTANFQALLTPPSPRRRVRGRRKAASAFPGGCVTKTWIHERSGLPREPARPQIDSMAQPAVDLNALRQLSVAERIQLVADLWDSIALEAPDDAFPMSPALAAELDRRMADLNEGRVQPVSWEEVRKQILHGTLGKP